MKMEATYEDLYDNPATLTENEMSWFETICRQCTEAVEIKEDIPIYSMNHSRLKGKSKEAYGIIWKSEDQTYITIDTYFIHECYESVFHNAWNVTFETLEHVIAHEFAHLFYWRHGKRHTEKTEELYARIQNNIEESR